MAEHEDASPDIYFEPIVKLKPIEVKSMEEDEVELIKLRARLYRYANEESPAEWKERGTGEIKLLRKQGSTNGKVRLLMRRDKTLKICANHYISPTMDLKPNCGSDKAFVWNTPADFTDEEPKPETLAIRFGNAENAKKFKEKFEECQRLISSDDAIDEKKDEEPENESKEEKEKEGNKSKEEEGDTSTKDEADKVADKLGGMSVSDADKIQQEADKESSKTGEAKEDGKVESTTDSQGSGDAKEQS